MVAGLDKEEEGEVITNLRESRSIQLQQYQASNKLSIMSLNAQSINDKFQQIRDATHKISPVVLCIQETWGKI